MVGQSPFPPGRNLVTNASLRIPLQRQSAQPKDGEHPRKGAWQLIPAPCLFANFALEGTELTLIEKCPLLNLPLIRECEPTEEVSTESDTQFVGIPRTPSRARIEVVMGLSR